MQVLNFHEYATLTDELSGGRGVDEVGGKGWKKGGKGCSKEKLLLQMQIALAAGWVQVAYHTCLSCEWRCLKVSVWIQVECEFSRRTFHRTHTWRHLQRNQKGCIFTNSFILPLLRYVQKDQLASFLNEQTFL